MTSDLPNYATLEPPKDKSIDDYTAHERRAAILRQVKAAGSPFAVKQVALADRYGVHESTISRDMDRLRESVAAHLGQDAKLTTRALLEKTIRELHAEGEWKDAWGVMMDWNEWLADLGEQYREPRRSELGVDVSSQHAEVAYTIVRNEEALPTTADGNLDYDALGFTGAPALPDAEASEGETDE